MSDLRANKKKLRRPARRTGSVQSVERSIMLLDALADYGGGVSLGELSKRAELNPSTAHRLLSTLIGLGCVRQDARTKLYRLGLRLLRLGEGARVQLNVVDEAMEEITELASRTQETSNIMMPSGDEIIVVAQIFSRHGPLGLFAPLGASVPVHCTAGGKCILAHRPENEIERFFKAGNLPALTPNTITNPLQLRDELERVRLQGYAVDNEERERGIRCVASPVRDVNGHVIAAISVSAPSGRILLSQCQEIGLIVSQCAERISARLGWRPTEDAEKAAVGSNGAKAAAEV